MSNDQSQNNSTFNLNNKVNSNIIDSNIVNDNIINDNIVNDNNRYSTPPRRINKSSPPSIKEERMNNRNIILKRCRTPSPTELNKMNKHFI